MNARRVASLAWVAFGLGVLSASCRTPSRSTATPDRTSELLCDAARKDRTLLGLSEQKWDGGACGGLFTSTKAGCGVEEGVETHSRTVVRNLDGWRSSVCGGSIESCGTTFACICAASPSGWHRPGVQPRCDGPVSTSRYLVPLDCSAPADGGYKPCMGGIDGAVKARIVDCVARDLWSPRNDFVAFDLLAKTDGGAIVASLQLDIPKYEALPGAVPFFQLVRAKGTAGLEGRLVLQKEDDRPRLGTASFTQSGFTDNQHGVDSSTATPHGCLSARFDLPPVDGGMDAGSAYLWLSY